MNKLFKISVIITLASLFIATLTCIFAMLFNLTNSIILTTVFKASASLGVLGFAVTTISGAYDALN